MFLENWLHDIIKSTLNTDAEYRGFVDKNSPGRLSRSDVEMYQSYKLRRTLQYAFERSSFYREHFHAAGVELRAIHDLSDLSKLPLTEPLDLADEPYRFLCISQAEIARPYTFVTSGTTGPQKKIFWTHRDLEHIIDFMAAGIGMVVNHDDVVQIILPDGRPYSQSDLLYRGVTRFGARPVLAGVDLDAREHLRIIELNRSTVVFGYVSQLFRLSKELESQEDLGSKGVRVLFLAAEYLPEVRRQELERIWNCRVHTHYGLTEMGLGVAVECEARNGYHFNEADLLLEVINPQTGETVEAGEEGELVFTTLTREAMPLIRYRTHDISRLIVDPCPCGAESLLKIDKVRKRVDSIIPIGDGDQLYPTLFDDVIFGIPGLIDYQLVVMQAEGKDRLHFKIEMISKNPDAIPAIKKQLLSAPLVAKNITSGKMTEPTVEPVGWGSLKSTSRTKKMILDRRITGD